MGVIISTYLSSGMLEAVTMLLATVALIILVREY